MRRTGYAAARTLLLACAASLSWISGLDGQPPPRRVVSLLPAATELIEALGVGDRLVAVTRHDVAPAARGLPRVGGPADPSLEAIVARRPDVVVAWAGVTPERDVRRLESMGARVYRARVETVDDVVRTARELGKLLGRNAAGDSLARTVEASLDSLRDAASGERPSVLLVLHPRPPLLTAGPGTYLDELVRIAGGRNVFGDASVRWPRVSTETVIDRDADVVIVSEEDAAAFLEAAPWRSLEAIEKGRVLVVPEARLLHPGPASVELAGEMVRFLARVSAGEGR